MDIRPFDTPFRSITNLRSFGDGERISSEGCLVDSSANEPIEFLVARCMRSGRFDPSASGAVRNVSFSDDLLPEEHDGFDIADLSQVVDAHEVAVKPSAAIPAASASVAEAPKVASEDASNQASNGGSGGSATV